MMVEFGRGELRLGGLSWVKLAVQIFDRASLSGSLFTICDTSNITMLYKHIIMSIWQPAGAWESHENKKVGSLVSGLQNGRRE
jgi:hypothetical protein